MSEYEALRSDLAGLGEAMNLYAGSVNRHTKLTDEQVGRIWDDIAELRDELHAVANRLENLTRAVTTDPAEVAQAIVNDANRGRLHALTGKPLVLAGRSGDHVDCLACLGSGTTPEGGRCDKCNGYGQVAHQ